MPLGRIQLGLSLMPTEDWWVANEPLFRAGLVDAVEWSVDFGFGGATIPDWVTSLLDTYEHNGALLAHGVEGSLMSATLGPEAPGWLANFRESLRARNYRHATEHYGFITAAEFDRGTPFPCPPSRALLELSVERWKRVAADIERPLGIENLAFAFSRDDAFAQAEFISELVERTDGFLLLDLHNLHCQVENLRLDEERLLSRYDLTRVREIHLAGGSLFSTSTGRFRRDTHDDLIPKTVVSLLGRVLPRCPNLEAVIVERTDRSLFGVDEAEAHRAEFLALRTLLAEALDLPATPQPPTQRSDLLITDEVANARSYQEALLKAMRGVDSAGELKVSLIRAEPGYTRYVSSFDDGASQAALTMARQWIASTPREGKMVAAVFRSPSWPLDFVNLPIPTPGEGQVLLRTAAVGLCGTDVHIVEGRFDVPTPIVLGHETVGEVLTLGEGVTSLRAGDRVGVSWVQSTCGDCVACHRGRAVHCDSPRTWIENGGGLSEYVIAEASGCTVLPEALSFEAAAPMFCGGHVAMSAFRNARVETGERVGVLGFGGIGYLTAQIAAAHDAEVVVITGRASKRGELRASGVRVPVIHGGDPTVSGSMESAFDVIISTTSDTSQIAGAIQWLRPGGRLIVVGLGEVASFDPALVVSRELSIMGSIQGPRADLEAVLSLAAAGKVEVPVEAFPLLIVQRALNRLIAGRVRHRAIITFA